MKMNLMVMVAILVMRSEMASDLKLLPLMCWHGIDQMFH